LQAWWRDAFGIVSVDAKALHRPPFPALPASGVSVQSSMQRRSVGDRCLFLMFAKETERGPNGLRFVPL
jgi:hypothetical protein